MESEVVSKREVQENACSARSKSGKEKECREIVLRGMFRALKALRDLDRCLYECFT